MPDDSVVLDLGGVRLAVTATAAGWIDRIRRAFGSLALPVRGDGPPDFSLKIDEGQPDTAAPDLPLTWEGIQNDGNYGRIYESARSAVLHVEDGGALVIDHAARDARATFRPGAFARFFGTPIMMVVDAALSANGQELVHAACLVERRSGRAVLISAPSGSGKTTTSLALARSGFGVVTDDASVVIPGSPMPRAWGLPRDFKVHRKTAEMLDWLGPLPDAWDDNDEQGLAAKDLADLIDIASCEPVELGAVIHLGPRSQGDHRVTRLDKAEALVALAHDNVAWRPSGMVPKAVRKFQVLADAIARVPTYQLSAGPDLASLPAALSAVLADREVVAMPGSISVR